MAKNISVFNFIKGCVGVFLLLFFSSNWLYAQYNSNPIVGNYEDAISWNGVQPPSDGSIANTMTIVSLSTITRIGAINLGTIGSGITVNSAAYFNVKGDFNAGQQLLVNGKVVIEGNASFTNGNGLIINNGGVVEIFGNLSVSNPNVNVAQGGMLIVHGNATQTGGNCFINGDAVIGGSFSINSATTIVDATGNMVVGGNFSFNNGSWASPTDSHHLYFLDPNVVVSVPNWHFLYNNPANWGDEVEFYTNETTNTLLLEVVNRLGIGVFTWLGDANTNSWTTASNWSRGVVPSTASAVIINKNSGKPNPEIGSLDAVTIKSLSVSTGNSLTFAPGARVTVTGGVANGGGTILLKNSVSSPTSFMTQGIVSAPVSVEWIYPAGRYMYIGHCVSGGTYANYQALSPEPFLYQYTTGAWAQITAGSFSFDTNVLEGYAFRNNGTSDATLTLTGNLRTSNYTININGWHLIGNPYSTYIDLENAGFNRGNALSTVWISTSASGSLVYATYNTSTKVGVNGGSRYVAPGQSFWIRNYAPSTLSINNSVRTHAAGALKSANTADDVLRLIVTKDKQEDESVLVFRDIGDDNYSPIYDSEKRFSSGISEVAIYTEKSGVKLAINALPENLDRQSIPLFINVGANKVGFLTIKWPSLSAFNPNTSVLLLDKVTGELIDCRQESSYGFYSESVSSFNRFELSFVEAENEEQIITALEKSLYEDVELMAYVLNSEIVVRVSKKELNEKVVIEVRDIVGYLYHDVISYSNETKLKLPDNTKIYLVKVTYKNKVKIQKVVSGLD